MRSELKPKGNGLYYLPVRKAEDGTEYVPAEYLHVNMWCNCDRKDRYCTNFLAEIEHREHICVRCGGIMASCRTI